MTYSAINIINNTIIIYGHHIIKHDYYLHRVSSLLYALYQMRNEIQGKKIQLTFLDGEPITFSGIAGVVDKIVDMLKLSADQFEVLTNDTSFQHNRATVIYQPSSFFRLLRNSIDITDWKLDQNAVLFGGVYGRFSIERFLLASYIDNNFANDSFVIFQPQGSDVEFNIDGLQTFFSEEYKWHCNKKEQNATLQSQYNGCVGWTHVIKDYKNIWPKYKIEIVAETDVHNSDWYTEKTIKCLISKKPFILLSGQHALKKLRNMGFKTFSPIINESYDIESDVNVRLDMIKQEMLRIYGFNNEEKIKMFEDLIPILDYNHRMFNSIVEKFYYDNSDS
jgi:hypothetical protein